MYMPMLCATTRPSTFSTVIKHPSLNDGQILPSAWFTSPFGEMTGALGESLALLADGARMLRSGFTWSANVGSAFVPQMGYGSDDAALDWLVQKHERGVSRTRREA